MPPAVENVILEHVTWQETFACVSAARSSHVFLFELSSAGTDSGDESSAGTSSARAGTDVESEGGDAESDGEDSYPSPCLSLAYEVPEQSAVTALASASTSRSDRLPRTSRRSGVLQNRGTGCAVQKKPAKRKAP